MPTTAILNQVKKLLSPVDYNNLDKDAINANIMASLGDKNLQSDYKHALYALHLTEATSFIMPTSAQAGDVSVSIDMSWLNSMPAALRPYLQSLTTTPWGQKLLQLLMMPHYDGSSTHVGAVEPVICGCGDCNCCGCC